MLICQEARPAQGTTPYPCILVDSLHADRRMLGDRRPLPLSVHHCLAEVGITRLIMLVCKNRKSPSLFLDPFKLMICKPNPAGPRTGHLNPYNRAQKEVWPCCANKTSQGTEQIYISGQPGFLWMDLIPSHCWVCSDCQQPGGSA